MDLENEQLLYKSIGMEKKLDLNELGRMTREGRHPELKKMKYQLILESVIWAVVLLLYYDAFDGHLKSLFWNLVLVSSILLLLVHNVLGYLIVKTPINGVTIKRSLENYLGRIQKYAAVSIGTRVVAVTCMVLFLTSDVTWDSSKLGYMLGFLLLIGFQVYALNRVWGKRRMNIRASFEAFN